MSNNFNTKPHFPFTYGDNIENDGQRLSDFIFNKLSEKETLGFPFDYGDGLDNTEAA